MLFGFKPLGRKKAQRRSSELASSLGEILDSERPGGFELPTFEVEGRRSSADLGARARLVAAKTSNAHRRSLAGMRRHGHCNPRTNTFRNRRTVLFVRVSVRGTVWE